MFQLPESPQRLRQLRIAIALFICLVCLVLGWPFINAAAVALSHLQLVESGSAFKPIVRALLPGIVGAFLWSVSAAFLLFTLIKIDFKGRSEHIAKLLFVQRVGRSFLLLTVPIVVLWVLGNVVAGG